MEGPWVKTSEAAAWRVVTRTMPHSDDYILGGVLIEVRDKDGDLLLLPPGALVRGVEARAIIKEPNSKVVTVHLESVEG